MDLVVTVPICGLCHNLASLLGQNSQQTTSSDLWSQISSSTYLVGDDSSRLLHLLDNLPGKANNLLSSGKILLPNPSPNILPVKEALVFSYPPLEDETSASCEATKSLKRTPTCTSWLLLVYC
ncbi:hypothetical protein DSO57_1001614 [Entomophthora muscae]|uniref:Uncharacterized protein n=1 Tax=Entomophthora muscae TaxID=34485 RepID=A0ACC2RZU0_9FUNG|nr:hypothetical protein DSO57_1001614 [Entomophthora muscae]